ncbi:MAG TPA: hypothetical protein VJB92_03120 [Candidatus Paceibacterota bacterium]
MFKKLAIAFFIIVAVGAIGAGFYLWSQSGAVRGLEITLGVPSEIRSGSPFDFSVSVTNRSSNVLKEAELIIELPEDVIAIDSPGRKTLLTKTLGNLGPGSFTEEAFELLALGGENTVKELMATVRYLPGSLGSQFERSEKIAFSVGEPSVSLDLSMPQKVFSGEEFEIAVSYGNISDRDFDDLRLKITYPPSFIFKSSSLKPDFGNNVWDLGALRSSSEGKFTIKGELRGPDESFFELAAVLDASFFGRSYTITRKTASIAIASSPLSLEIKLNDTQDFIAHAGSDLNYTLNFKNNTDIGLRDVIVKAKLTGEMFDVGTLRTNASLQSTENQLIWNAGNTPLLSILSPGSSGSVNFSVRAKANYPIRRLSDRNFVLKVEAEIESPTVPQSVTAERTLGIARLETKVGGAVAIDAQGFFRDAASGILNKGPWPLKVGQPTNFTIHWLVRNYSTDVNNLTIKAFLGNNVRLTGVIKSNGGIEPLYNERTQEVVWSLGKISATKGVLTNPLEAVFQVEATPSVNQVGGPIVLIRETAAEATDEFTNETLTARDTDVTTTSLDDATVKQSEGIVAQ